MTNDCQAVYIDESYSDKAQNRNDLISCLQPMAIDIPSHRYSFVREECCSQTNDTARQYT